MISRTLKSKRIHSKSKITKVKKNITIPFDRNRAAKENFKARNAILNQPLNLPEEND